MLCDTFSTTTILVSVVLLLSISDEPAAEGIRLARLDRISRLDRCLEQLPLPRYRYYKGMSAGLDDATGMCS